MSELNISQQTLGIIYISLCIFLWSLLGIFVKFAGSSLDHYQYMFYSSIVSFLSLLVVAIFNKKAKEILSYSKKVLIFLLFLGFLDFAFYLLLYFGYHNAPSLEVLVIQYTWPIFIVILSLIILKEEFTKRKFFAVLLGFVGVALVITKGDISSFSLNSIDVLLVVMLSAFCFALFSAFFLILVFDEPILIVYFVGLAFVVMAGLVNSIKVKKARN